jgi:hypothetical protein
LIVPLKPGSSKSSADENEIGIEIIKAKDRAIAFSFFDA